MTLTIEKVETMEEEKLQRIVAEVPPMVKRHLKELVTLLPPHESGRDLQMQEIVAQLIEEKYNQVKRK